MRVGQLSLTERQQIVARYEAGERAKGLATAFKVDRGTIASILVSAGKRRPRSMTPAEVEKAGVLYRSGWSLARIGDESAGALRPCDRG